ncbi:MAG: bifunctional glutamate N-acetyltransferase/amino-acid acetyltransferase ArgJ [Candidatus Poribacteria bacterium]|nr:bifunctional glutamate N-acetyltransferase/amino-acid acetyltransferase ArgJ [Candidatus Poribacteria bacterium]
MKQIEDGITAVSGVRAAGVHAGIKAAEAKDVALIVTDTPATAAGVFTKNSVTAAPVIVCREHLKAGQAQAVIVNSGNANACTGEVGMANARRMASTAAEQLGIDAELVLVSSTGVIGQQLPMDKIENGIRVAASALSPEGGSDAAEAIMTTDTHPKSVAIEVEIEGAPVRIGGIAKGSGMIAPNMATMLSYLTTDAKINAETLQTALNRVVDDTYNLLTVDTDRSTNDTVLILATGHADHTEIVAVDGEDYEAFCDGLLFVCTELVKMLARDGEGATKLVEVVVKRAKNRDDAEKAARAVAESPLVKTAVFANDANWGRIMMAIGKSGAEFDPYQVDVYLADYQLVKNGMDASYDEDKATALFAKDPVRITIDLRAGDATVTMWTCDYSYDYIRINADYRT